MNFKDEKVDNQSDDSAASSADSGVILNDDLLMSDKNRCNVDITTSIECANKDTLTNKSTINIENIINIAKNVSPTNKGSPKKATPSNGSSSSPTSSIRSTCISITSIQSDALSSVIDSDCDVDDFEDSNGNYTIKKLGHQTSCLSENGGLDIPKIGGNDGMVLLEQRVDVDTGQSMDVLAMASTSLSSGSPQIGNMAFTNSTDITIGQKNYYQGPVTIQQFLIENRNRDAVRSVGNDNPVFQDECPSTARKMSGNHNDSSDDNSSPHQPYKFMFNRRAFIITAVIIALTIMIGGIFATSSYMMKRSSKQDEDEEENRKHIPVNTTIGKDNFGGGTVLRMVPRDEWLARPAAGVLDKLNLPVHRVIIAHTATESCSSQSQCSYRTKIIQEFHIDSRGFDDIAYNFLVGGDGAVYEGRGWDLQGAHTKGYNVDSICVAFIGTFEQVTPPESQLNATKLIIQEGVRLNKLVKDYKLYGARQLMGSQSPGLALYEIIKKWPHWSPN